jgi:hypothetical protein
MKLKPGKRYTLMEALLTSIKNTDDAGQLLFLCCLKHEGWLIRDLKPPPFSSGAARLYEAMVKQHGSVAAALAALKAEALGGQSTPDSSGVRRQIL